MCRALIRCTDDRIWQTIWPVSNRDFPHRMQQWFLYKDLVGLIAFGNYGLLRQNRGKTGALIRPPHRIYSSFQSSVLTALPFEWTPFYWRWVFITWVDGMIFKSDVKKNLTLISGTQLTKTNEDWTRYETANPGESPGRGQCENKCGDEAAWGTHPGMRTSIWAIRFHTEHLQIGTQIRRLGMIKWQELPIQERPSTDYSGFCESMIFWI